MDRRANPRHASVRTSGVFDDAQFSFAVGQSVVTCDSYPGRITARQAGAYPGQESYTVELENGLGGGEYRVGDIVPVDPEDRFKEGRRYSQTPLVCDKCGRTATTSMSGGLDGHTMLCPECADARTIERTAADYDPARATDTCVFCHQQVMWDDESEMYLGKTSWMWCPARGGAEPHEVDGFAFEGTEVEASKRTAARADLPLAPVGSVRTAEDDYPELSGILWERPDHVEALSTGVRSLGRKTAGAPGHTAALSLEAVISVAEETMERTGNSGAVIEVPVHKFNSGPLEDAKIRPFVERVEAMARLAGYMDPINAYTHDYALDRAGHAQAMVDRSSFPVRLVVRPVTNEMTILHEIAHLVRGSNEGDGHDAEFARTLHQIYARQLGPAAADVFWGIVGVYVDGGDAKTAARTEDGAVRPYRGFEMRFHTEDQGERKPRMVIETFHGATRIGTLSWYGTTGTIHHIEVEPEYLRQGIATAMWEWGQEMRPAPVHSGDRTTQGDAWARAVGGPIPRRNSSVTATTIREQIEDPNSPWWFRHITGPAAERANNALPPGYRMDDIENTRGDNNWCRFRRDSHCWFPHELDVRATQVAGYDVWIPVDRGTCHRRRFDTQAECEISEPGPQSGDPNWKPDATRRWDQGGQRVAVRKRAAWRENAGVYEASIGDLDFAISFLSRDQTNMFAGFDANGLKVPIFGWFLSVFSSGYDDGGEFDENIASEYGPFDTIDEAKATAERMANGRTSALVRMSAKNFETGRWFHGTNARLSPGDQIVPGLGAVHGDENDRVWVASNAWVASAYGSLTYEVTPNDAPRKRSKAGEFFCGGATVVREVPVDEIRTSGNEWWALTSKSGAWKDVRDKGVNIRRNGGVHIIANTGLTVTAEVQGEHGLYVCTITRVPGRKQQGLWRCSCKWNQYAWARSEQWKRLEGRQCSHVYALLMEMQSQEMFGGTIEEENGQPMWREMEPILESPMREADPSPRELALALENAMGALHLAMTLTEDHGTQERIAHLLEPAGIAPCGGVDLADRRPGARFGGAFPGKVRGRVTTVEVTPAGVVADGQLVDGSEVLYPTWDPYVGLEVVGAKSKASDFSVGQRVVVRGHPDEPGTVSRITGQYNSYTKCLIWITFDGDERGAPVPFHFGEVSIVDDGKASKTGAQVGRFNLTRGTLRDDIDVDGVHVGWVYKDDADKLWYVRISGPEEGQYMRLNYPMAKVVVNGQSTRAKALDDFDWWLSKNEIFLEHKKREAAERADFFKSLGAKNAAQVVVTHPEGGTSSVFDFGNVDLDYVTRVLQDAGVDIVAGSAVIAPIEEALAGIPGDFHDDMSDFMADMSGGDGGASGRFPLSVIAGLAITAADEEIELPTEGFEFAGLIIKSYDSGRILMTQRSPFHGDDEKARGKWEFPGGHLEEGETPFEGALREFTEETGLPLPEKWKIVGYHESGKYLAIVIAVDNETWTSDAVLLDFETMGIGWFHPDEVEGSEMVRGEIQSTDFDMVREASKAALAESEAILHDEPEPALPATYGSDEDDPGRPFVPGDARLSHLAPNASDGAGNEDIASAAAAFLQKQAVKVFSPAEQQLIIDEGAKEHLGASNTDRLDLTGTFYELSTSGDDPIGFW